MTLNELVCWQTVTLEGVEHVCMTIQEWDGLNEVDKCMMNDARYCRSPLNRHWLTGKRWLLVKIMSATEVAVIKFNTVQSSRSVLGLAHL